jgi:hypothetical protein
MELPIAAAYIILMKYAHNALLDQPYYSMANCLERTLCLLCVPFIFPFGLLLALFQVMGEK